MKMLKENPRSLMSTLWIFVLLNMIFRDLHELAKKSYIENILSSNINEELLLIFGFILEIPILMVVLSRILDGKLNKWANLFAVSVMLIGFSTTLSSADMDDIFFMAMETLALLAITIIAWTLPKTRTQSI
jgi:Sec-independent protein secretion pathway component TatC